MARWSDRLIGSNDLQRFDRYTLASMQIVMAIDFLVALASIASFPVHLPGVLMVSTAVLALVAWVVSAWLLAPAVRSTWLGSGLGRRSWQLLVGLWLVTQLVALALFPRTDQAWGSAGPLALALGLPMAMTLGAALRGRRLHAMAAAAVLLPVLLGMPTQPAGRRHLVLVACYGALLVYTGTLSSWMLRVLHDLDQARATSARLAVAEERLRFSRDLHDVVGRSLSAVALKSQLAAELARRGRSEQAMDEMLAVHRIADEALAEMRQVVAGMRTADLDRELDSARSVLQSAGVTLALRGADPSEFTDPAVRQGLAWALREAVTNVVRHSRALRCTITLETGSHAVLTVWNDGASASDGAAGRSGSGLVGLSERLAAIGGRLSTEHRSGEFTLQARVPVAGTRPVGGPQAGREGS